MQEGWLWMTLAEKRLFGEWLRSTYQKGNQEQSEPSPEQCGCQDKGSCGTSGEKKPCSMPQDEADGHWEWVLGILKTSRPTSEVTWWRTCEYLYKTALQHGYKHAIEDYVEDQHETTCCK